MLLLYLLLLLYVYCYIIFTYNFMQFYAFALKNNKETCFSSSRARSECFLALSEKLEIKRNYAKHFKNT